MPFPSQVASVGQYGSVLAQDIHKVRLFTGFGSFLSCHTSLTFNRFCHLCRFNMPQALILLSLLAVTTCIIAVPLEVTNTHQPALQKINAPEYAKRFECDFDLRISNKERAVSAFAAAGCLVGTGLGLYRDEERVTIISGLGSLFFSAVSFFANKTKGQKRSLLGDIGIDIPTLSPIDDLLDHIHVPNALRNSDYLLMSMEPNGMAVARSTRDSDRGSRIRFSSWNATKVATTNMKRDSDGLSTGADSGDVVHLEADYDNDVRSAYFLWNQDDFTDAMSQIWDHVGQDENDYDAGTFMETFCAVPIDDQGNPVFVGTAWINDGADASNPNCDNLAMQHGGYGSFDSS